MKKNIYLFAAALAIYCSVEAMDSGGSTPLMEATWAGEADKAESLIKLGANVNAKSTGEWQWTPLLIAIYQSQFYPEYKYYIQALLNAGANPNLAGQLWGRSYTPYQLAELRNQREIMQILQEAGAKVSSVRTGKSFFG